MSKLDQKLRENRNRRARDVFLLALGGKFGDILSEAKYSSDVACIKYAAFATWDMEADCETTTRGQVIGWENHTFKTWQELITELKRSSHGNDVNGWFFNDTDGPYYQVSLESFLANADSISVYADVSDHRDFGWVGAERDCGMIIEFNHTSLCRNEYELCTWGI